MNDTSAAATLSHLLIQAIINSKSVNFSAFMEWQDTLNAVISLSYVVNGSKTGDMNQDDVRRDTFSHKFNVKIGRVVSDDLFWQRKNMHGWKMFRKIKL